MDEDIVIIGTTEYAGQTTVHPLGLVALVCLGLCVLLLPRRWSIVPMLVMACFVSSAQRIVIAGADFDFLRIMVLFGIMRLILRGEYSEFIWQPLDTVVAVWTVSSMFFLVIRVGTFSAVINRLGFGFDAFGMYFLFRCLIQKWQDIDHILVGVIIISIPVAVFFMVEQKTGHNLFAIFGGVSEITDVRESRLRCQGAFSHAILAGSFWAALLPLIVAYGWKSKSSKFWVGIGIVCAMIIVICSASATPLISLMMGLMGGLFFFLRRYMRYICWSALIVLIALHWVMKAPVWHLIGRINPVGGATGYHRYLVIDLAIKHFDQWWFAGCSPTDIYNWGLHAGDVTNQFIAQGVTSGFLTMCLFIAAIVIGFREVGRLWRLHEQNPYRLAVSWALGVSLFVHCVNFIGVTYFGQINMLWYLALALIASVSGFGQNKINFVAVKKSTRN